MAGLTGVLVRDRHAIRRLFTGDPLVKRHGNALLRTLVGEQSPLLLEPAEHLARRKMLPPPFHGERVQSYARIMERLMSAGLDRLRLASDHRVPAALQTQRHPVHAVLLTPN
jgi:cytochrome P450